MGTPKDRSGLSRKPSQIRNRIRRNHDMTDEDIHTYLEVIGKPIDQWDFEELARGRPRNVRGNFAGTTPEWITPHVVAEAKRRLLLGASAGMAKHLDAALKMIGSLMENTDTDDFGRPVVDAKTKLAAAQFVIEHTLGKPQAVVQITGDDQVKQALAAAIVLDDGLPQDAPSVIEGQVVEEEYEEDDDE